jgi:hypothetical protein
VGGILATGVCRRTGQGWDGNCVVFFPDTPETNKGFVLLAKNEQTRVVSSITANQPDESL